MYFYSDTAPRASSNINIWKMNGSAAYLRHYENYLFLDFISRQGTRAERASAEKEIEICKRKLDFWEKHPNFDAEFVRREKERMIKNWQNSKKA